MIIDKLENAPLYFGLHPLFEKAFAWIAQTNLAEAEAGTSIIDGENLKAIVSHKPGMKPEESLAKFECHNEHIDIQLCIEGRETIGWKSRNACREPKGEYNPDKDVLFYADAPDTFFQLTNGHFAIFFPTDVHAPMIGEGEIRKLVIKVKK